MKIRKWVKPMIVFGFITIAGIFYTITHTLPSNEDVIELSQVENEDTMNMLDEYQSKEETTNEVVVDEVGVEESEKNTDQASVEISAQDTENEAYDTDLKAGSEPQVEETTDAIYVHICGAVRNPDVYEVNEDSRLMDVVDLAGGFTEDAASDYVNLAQKVADGQRFVIPHLSEVEDQSPMEYEVAGENSQVTSDSSSHKSSQSSSNSGKININTASKEELMTLPGVGDSKADKIMEYRSNVGEFQKIEDIMNINGIKDGLFQKICNLIIV